MQGNIRSRLAKIQGNNHVRLAETQGNNFQVLAFLLLAGSSGPRFWTMAELQPYIE
jgi:hypothetical protein